MPRKSEGYFKKKKNDNKLNFFSKYTKRYFVLDLDAETITYA